MTVGEVVRHIEAQQKIEMRQAKEKATYDYIMAGLIVKGFAISMGSKETYPRIEEAYPGIFADAKEEREEKINQQKTELSVLRFKQFAQSYNNKQKNKEVLTDNE